MSYFDPENDEIIDGVWGIAGKVLGSAAGGALVGGPFGLIGGAVLGFVWGNHRKWIRHDMEIDPANAFPPI